MAANLGNGIPAEENPYRSRNAFNRVGFTIGDEATNIRTIAIQLKTANGEAIAEMSAFNFRLLDVATSLALIATGVTSLAAGATGIYEAATAAKSGKLYTNAVGRADLAIEFTGGAKTLYLAIEMPDGSYVISSAIVFV